jgi:hypothetical protein
MKFRILADATFEAVDIDDAMRVLAAHLMNRAGGWQTPSPLSGGLTIAPPSREPNRNPDGSIMEGESYTDMP